MRESAEGRKSKKREHGVTVLLFIPKSQKYLYICSKLNGTDA